MMNLQLRSDFRCKYGDHIQHTQDESKFSEHDTPARADFLIQDCPTQGCQSNCLPDRITGGSRDGWGEREW